MEQPDSMELKVISCKDLKAFNFFQKLNIYVVVSIVNEDEDDDDDSTPSPTKTNNEKKKKKQQKQKTPIDREGDGNPEWNYVMRFDLKDIFKSSSCSSLLLEFDLLSEGTILGDKTIGRVRVPFEDVINEFNGGAVRFVSYQVRTTDGIPNGVLDFSFKPIIIHNHTHSFVEDNKFGNEAAAPLPIGNNTNGDDVPLNYHRPMPSTNYYPPPLLPVVDNDDDGSYINPFSETHNPSPRAESYYPRIDQFHHNPSLQEEIHYPTLEIHSPQSSEYHNPSPPEVYYPQPQPQVDYHQLPPPPSSHHHHHHHHHSHPQVAYYPPLSTVPPLFYPPTTDPYGGHDQFGRGNPNPSIAYGYPNYWASTPPPPPPPIHW